MSQKPRCIWKKTYTCEMKKTEEIWMKSSAIVRPITFPNNILSHTGTLFNLVNKYKNLNSFSRLGHRVFKINTYTERRFNMIYFRNEHLKG